MTAPNTNQPKEQFTREYGYHYFVTEEEKKGQWLKGTEDFFSADCGWLKCPIANCPMERLAYRRLIAAGDGYEIVKKGTKIDSTSGVQITIDGVEWFNWPHDNSIATFGMTWSYKPIIAFRRPIQKAAEQPNCIKCNGIGMIGMNIFCPDCNGTGSKQPSTPQPAKWIALSERRPTSVDYRESHIYVATAYRVFDSFRVLNKNESQIMGVIEGWPFVEGVRPSTIPQLVLWFSIPKQQPPELSSVEEKEWSKCWKECFEPHWRDMKWNKREQDAIKVGINTALSWSKQNQPPCLKCAELLRKGMAIIDGQPPLATSDDVRRIVGEIRCINLNNNQPVEHLLTQLEQLKFLDLRKEE